MIYRARQPTRVVARRLQEFEVKLRFLMYSISLIALYLCLKDLDPIINNKPFGTISKLPYSQHQLWPLLYIKQGTYGEGY